MAFNRLGTKAIARFPLLFKEGIGEVMKKIFNNLDQKRIRRSLRSELPRAEQILWNQLRGYQLGFKFRRQVSIGPYIVDFYCPKKKIVIEVDGDSHYESGKKEYDKARSEYIISKGVFVVRFTNLEVYDDLEGVLSRLKELLNKI